MTERTAEQKYNIAANEPITWWSWRPGISPRHALLLGGLLSIIALLLIMLGTWTLVVEILDSLSPPLQVPGVVIASTPNSVNGFTRLNVRMHSPGFPTEVFPLIAPTTPGFANGETLVLDYSPHFHVLSAVERAGRRYALPGSGMGGMVIGSVALLLMGVILLPYPLVLVRWGWLDIYGYKKGESYREMRGRVIGLRQAGQVRTVRTGLIPHPARAWYGVALAPTEKGQGVMTFALSQEQFVGLHEGEMVRVKYTPHVHYIYALETIDER